MSKAVGIEIDGEVEWHAPGNGVTDHHSLCGVDAQDHDIGHGGLIEPVRGQKITCPQCHAIWRRVLDMKLRSSDFHH